MALSMVFFLGLPRNCCWYIASSIWPNVWVGVVTFTTNNVFLVTSDVFTVNLLFPTMSGCFSILSFSTVALSQKSLCGLSGVGDGLFSWLYICCSGLSSLFCVIGAYHKLLIVLLLSFVIVLPAYTTSSKLLKTISQPALHNHTFDKRKCFIIKNYIYIPCLSWKAWCIKHSFMCATCLFTIHNCHDYLECVFFLCSRGVWSVGRGAACSGI